MRAFLGRALALALTLTAMAGCTGGDKPVSEGMLSKVKARGHLNCGASQGIPGLSRPDEKGVWRGFDADVCRAVAAAVFGDASKVQYVPLNAAQRLPAVQTGEIDVLSRTTTITFTRDMAIRFVAVTLYDTDAVIVRRSMGVTDPKGLNQRTICLQGGGSLVENTLDEVEQEYGITLKRVYFDSTITARDTFFAGRCDAYVTDGLAARSQLATVAKNPEEFNSMFIGHSVEPNGLAIARGDERWFDIMRWTVNVLIWAEEKGVTQANVDEKLKSGSAEVKRVLGADGGAYGRAIGLHDRWAYDVIKQVGNYGEIWNRNLGEGSPIKADRRMNKLFRQGGLLFPLPWD